MKKIAMILAAASVVALSGCVKENVSSNKSSAGPGIRTIRVGVSDPDGAQTGDQTKVGVHIDRDAQNDTYYWKDGDAVILCGVDAGAFTGQNSRFELDPTSVGAGKGTFTLAAGEQAPTEGTYLAVHVHNDTGLTPPARGGTVGYAIPASLAQTTGAEDVADYMLLAAQVTLASDGTIPNVMLSHKMAVVELGITASDPTLVDAKLTGVSMMAGTAAQYAGQVDLDPSGDAAAAAGRNTNALTVSAPAATLSADKPCYVRMVTLMNAAAAGTVTFTVTARSASGITYVSDVTKTSIDLIAGHVRPATIDLTSHAIGIYTAAQLDAVRNDLSSNYILMNDISLADYSTGEGWAPIGTDVTTPFTGKFNGNGYKITGLAINRPNAYASGLFGCIASGSVSDLGVEIAAGGVNNGVSFSGGIAGWVSNGTVTNCYSTGNISGPYSGGITGRANDGSTINGCYSMGDISANSYSSGGVAGLVENSTITGCHSTGNISSDSGSSYSGGIAGNMTDGSSITDCYSTGNITSTRESGGIVGDAMTDNTITDCYSTGNISCNSSTFSDSGGIAGYISGSTITGCHSTGGIYSYSSSLSLSDSSHSGGVAGSVGGSSKLTDCYSAGNISSNNISGGIAGYLSSSTITGCHSTGSVSSSNSSYYSYSGGIVGSVGTGTITNCYNTGTISSSATSSYYSYSGGITASAANGITITNCYNTGDVSSSSPSGYAFSGGMAGYVSGSTITNCYNTGDISADSGSSYSGGIVGQLFLSSTITGCAAADLNIYAQKYAGRIVGSIYTGPESITNNFALTGMNAVGAAFNTSAANHGADKSLVELQTQSTYSDPVASGGLGWAFGTTDAAPWQMPAGGSFPVLYWQK